MTTFAFQFGFPNFLTGFLHLHEISILPCLLLQHSAAIGTPPVFCLETFCLKTIPRRRGTRGKKTCLTLENILQILY